jgi:hypothetical protein
LDDQGATAHDVLIQLAVALGAAIDKQRPHMTTARVTSIHARIEAAIRGGPDSTQHLISDLAKLSAGWRRADHARPVADAQAWGYITDSGA